jgi:TetR/AcrR family transcriptional repressor of nem operon
MARPREFDEEDVLEAALQCFWARGFDKTSVKDLIDNTGLTAASLYNAFGDKRALYERALENYVEGSIADRIRRCQRLAPRDAIQTFFAEVLKRSLGDRERKGCMLINAALEVAPHDPDFRKAVGGVLTRIEGFFLERLRAGQADGTVTRSLSAEDHARHLLGVLIGVRVLARVRPEPRLLEGAVRVALAALERPNTEMSEL